MERNSEKEWQKKLKSKTNAILSLKAIGEDKNAKLEMQSPKTELGLKIR